jgi:hypothetical protein
MTDPSYWTDLVRPLVAGRKVIVAGTLLAGATGHIALLKSMGAQRPFILASGIGTGPLPTKDDAEWLVLESAGDDIVEVIRNELGHLQHLPEHAVAALDAYDPERTAVLHVPTYANDLPVGGRTPYGTRPVEWYALEDKTVCDQLWDAFGVRRAPFAVVPVEDGRRAAAKIDRGNGTVWSGDARDGMNGGAVYVRWVQSAEDADETEAFFGPRCDQVRVMPFLEGIPCAIHGMVFPDGIAVFRPIEMVTLRRPTQPRFLYSGCATYWDPPDADREAMRAVARRVGAGLAERFGFRGAFTVDGVLTGDGFLPTELNPRLGAGLNTMARALDDVPLPMIHGAAIAGEPFDFRAAEFEQMVVETADARRAGGAWTTFPSPRTESEMHPLVREWRLAGDDEEPDASLIIGPSNIGGFIRFQPDPGRTPAGPSIAPAAVSAFAFADQHFNTGLGPLEPARDITRSEFTAP